MISVIIPFYNVEKWLPACINSLLEQTYNDFQLILIDDGSTDDSAKICDEYAVKDSRIEIVHQNNRGASCARNLGIELAKGDFLAFVDGDDFCEKDMLQIAMENFKEDVDIVAFGFYRNLKKITVKKNRVSNNNDEALNLYIKNELNVAAWAKIFRRKVFENIRFPEGKLFEDMFIFPQITQYKILILNKALYHYVQRENSITTSQFKPRHMDFLESLKLWKGEEKLLRIVRLRVAWNILLFMENKPDKIYAEQLTQILRNEKTFFVPVAGFVNFILANMLAFGFSYSFVLSLRTLLKKFK